MFFCCLSCCLLILSCILNSVSIWETSAYGLGKETDVRTVASRLLSKLSSRTSGRQFVWKMAKDKRTTRSKCFSVTIGVRSWILDFWSICLPAEWKRFMTPGPIINILITHKVVTILGRLVRVVKRKRRSLRSLMKMIHLNRFIEYHGDP